jgi:hypothetical protein
MRNARGMTALNVALLCGFSNMASLLTAGAPIPAPPPAARARALPPLLRQQLLVLVHRAALLSQLRQLGLGQEAAASEGPPLLPPSAVQRLESLLHSENATPSQVLAAVDELLDGAAGADGSTSSGSGSAGRGDRGRRRGRRQAADRERFARQLAAAQAGADWTLLERGRTLWHAQHGGTSLYRRRAGSRIWRDMLLHVLRLPRLPWRGASSFIYPDSCLDSCLGGRCLLGLQAAETPRAAGCSISDAR